MTVEVIAFIAGLIKLEMVASVLLLIISVGVVAVLGSITWFVVTKLPTILGDWLTGFNAAVDKLAESVIRITADVSGTHQNTVTAGALLAAHDAQAKQIKEAVEELTAKAEEGNRMLGDIVVTLENRPCIIKR